MKPNTGFSILEQFLLFHHWQTRARRALTFPPSITGLSYFIPPTSPTGHTDTRWVLLIWDKTRGVFEGLTHAWCHSYKLCRYHTTDLQRPPLQISAGCMCCRHPRSKPLPAGCLHLAEPFCPLWATVDPHSSARLHGASASWDPPEEQIQKQRRQ